MIIGVYTSWDELMGRLGRDQIDLGVFVAGDTRYVYWNKRAYTRFLQTAFPNHRVFDHGDFLNIVIVGLSSEELKKRLLLTVVDSV